jgi:anthranilate phosphoribosyltransferase
MAILKDLSQEQRALTRAEARTALREMLTGNSSDAEVAALLTAMAQRGETLDELTGFAETMRELAVPVPLMEEERAQLIDTCGTGGDGRGTFNISTGAALVAAAAGAKVAKHGNRGVTSKCGSADVLEALGVAVALPPELAVESLRSAGFMFLYAPALHPAMRRVVPVRRALGFRTIFNLAGPLTNPARAPAQIMGVFAHDRVRLAAETMLRLSVRHAFESAAALERIFAGERGPKRDIVLLNAAAALVAGRIAADLREGVARAADAIDSGRVQETLKKLRSFAQKV